MTLVLPFITIAFVLMVSAWVMMIRFYQRYPLPPSVNPLEGPARWVRFFRGEGFPSEAEPQRKRIARLYIAALASFIIALIIFFAVGGPEALQVSPAPG